MSATRAGRKRRITLPGVILVVASLLVLLPGLFVLFPAF